MNPFLYASPLPTLLNGMLLHTPSHMHDRFTLTSTEAREEARNIKPDKTEAWKRRRKKPRLNHRSLRSCYTGVSGPATPESPDLPPDRPQQLPEDSLNATPETTPETDRSLRPRTESPDPTPESPACTPESPVYTGVSGPGRQFCLFFLFSCIG